MADENHTTISRNRRETDGLVFEQWVFRSDTSSAYHAGPAQGPVRANCAQDLVRHQKACLPMSCHSLIEMDPNPGRSERRDLAYNSRLGAIPRIRRETLPRVQLARNSELQVFVRATIESNGASASGLGSATRSAQRWNGFADSSRHDSRATAPLPMLLNGMVQAKQAALAVSQHLSDALCQMLPNARQEGPPPTQSPMKIPRG